MDAFAVSTIEFSEFCTNNIDDCLTFNCLYYCFQISSMHIYNIDEFVTVSADWSIHCATSYTKDGFWNYITQIATCSPWMFWMFLNSVFHFMWVAVLIMCQLYQVRYVQV